MAIPSTLVESPEWDPGFYFMYTAILPTYLFGIIFNAMVIGAMLSNQKTLISQRIDRIIFLLLAVHCIYSLFASVCQFLLRLWVASAAYSSFIGWTSSISILTLFVVNLALALERRVTIMSPTDPSIGRHASKIYTVLAILLLAFSCIMSWVYASSVS
ncbi:hypothetical protein BDR26DRAFT_714529 [Obelidium mucronatum]|nr:hypothetical protein BDR26DRAFT_714529 [Obelidium mucronatum]